MQNSPKLNKPGAGGLGCVLTGPSALRLRPYLQAQPRAGCFHQGGRRTSGSGPPCIHPPPPPNIASRAVQSEQTPEWKQSEQVGGRAQPGELEPGSTPA